MNNGLRADLYTVCVLRADMGTLIVRLDCPNPGCALPVAEWEWMVTAEEIAGEVRRHVAVHERYRGTV